MSTRERILLCVLLVAHLALLGHQVSAVGLTVDEPSHMLSAYLYWRGEDHLKPGDMPPLIKILGGWPSLFLRPPLPVNSPAWQSGHEWNISAEMINGMSGRQIDAWVFWSRAPFVLIGPLITLLLWRWARQLWGPAAALLIAAFWVFEPTALGHGALFKNDLAATLGYLAFWYAAWRFWLQPGWTWAGAVTLALTLALLTKISMLILLPLGPAILLARAAADRRWREAVLWPAAMLTAAYLLCSAACQFEMRRMTHAEAAAAGLPGWAASIPLPARYVNGPLSLIEENRDGRLVHFLGSHRPGGDRRYFLVAWAAKTPLPVLLLLLSSLALAAMRRQPNPDWVTAAFVVFPPVFYLSLASMSSLQLGYRLVLPAVPFFLLVCGAAHRWLLSRGKGWVAAAALTVTAITVLWRYPYTISFFNLAMPQDVRSRIQILADSNVDWGHGLPALRRWCLERHVRRIRLSYFGADPPYRYFPDSENMVELLAPPWSDELARGRTLEPEPGLWAISAGLLPGHFFEPRYRDYYRYFRTRPPLAVIAGSILVYRVPDK